MMWWVSWSCKGVRFRKVNGMHVVSGAAILAPLVFEYIAVRPRGCGNDDAGDVIVTGSFLAEEVDVLSRL